MNGTYIGDFPPYNAQIYSPYTDCDFEGYTYYDYPECPTINRIIIKSERGEDMSSNDNWLDLYHVYVINKESNKVIEDAPAIADSKETAIMRTIAKLGLKEDEVGDYKLVVVTVETKVLKGE